MIIHYYLTLKFTKDPNVPQIQISDGLFMPIKYFSYGGRIDECKFHRIYHKYLQAFLGSYGILIIHPFFFLVTMVLKTL
jgi:hypothetical protein